MMVRSLPWLFPRLVIVGALAGTLALAPATLHAGAASPAIRPMDGTSGPVVICVRRGQENDRQDNSGTQRLRVHPCHAIFTFSPGALIGAIVLGPDAVLRFAGTGPIGVQLDPGYVLLVFNSRLGRFVRAASQTQIDGQHAYAIVSDARYLSQLFRQNITLRPVVVGGQKQFVSGLALNKAKVVIKVSYKQRGAKSQTFTTKANTLGRFLLTFTVPYRPQGNARNFLATVLVSSNGVSASIPFVVTK